jgi:hypothetical protein
MSPGCVLRKCSALQGGLPGKDDCVTDETDMIDMIDSMSSGETEPQDNLNLVDWEPGTNKKKNLNKKIHLRAIRQSSRLKCHGGKTVEELATKRKQVLSLEVSGNKSFNPFDVLNSISDDYLSDTAKDLGINLDSNKEGCLAHISAMKAEERLEADIAEATYEAYLEELKERTQDTDMLDLSTIDNSQRGFPTSDSNHEDSSKKMGKKKKR